MKKILTFICVFFLIYSLSAQDFKYGVKAGLNINNLNVDPELDPPKPESRLGFHLGGFVQFSIADNIMVQPELTISTQGTNDEDPGDKERVKLTYLNLTGTFKYSLTNNFNFTLGPQLGFLVGGEFEEEDKQDGSKKSYDAGDVYSGTDLLLGLGVGYTLESGLGVDIRYNLGLTDNNDDPAQLGFYDPIQDIKSRVFQISVSYVLNL